MTVIGAVLLCNLFNFADYDVSRSVDESPVSFALFFHGCKAVIKLSDYFEFDIKISRL